MYYIQQCRQAPTLTGHGLAAYNLSQILLKFLIKSPSEALLSSPDNTLGFSLSQNLLKECFFGKKVNAKQIYIQELEEWEQLINNEISNSPELLDLHLLIIADNVCSLTFRTFNSMSTAEIFWNLVFSIIVVISVIGNVIVIWIICGESLSEFPERGQYPPPSHYLPLRLI